MSEFRQHYTQLDEAIDDIRGVLQRSTPNGALDGLSVDEDTLEHARLVLHEWLVNLIQHAVFQGKRPYVEVTLEFANRHVSCCVIDNSEGFDLQAQLELQEAASPPFPERGMGLRFIDACTRKVTYQTRADGLQQFSCIIPSNAQPWVNILS